MVGWLIVCGYLMNRIHFLLPNLAGLQTAFKTFGPMKIEWPGKDGRHPRYPPKGELLKESRGSEFFSIRI